MHKIKKHMLYLLLLTLYLSSCNTPRTMVGNDSDPHGCKGSAGYTWSELRKECVRPFEIGLQATGAKDPTRAAYILFSSDSLQVELFLPSSKEILLREKNSNKQQRYSAKKTSSTLLTQTDSGWQIHQYRELIFESKK